MEPTIDPSLLSWYGRKHWTNRRSSFRSGRSKLHKAGSRHQEQFTLAVYAAGIIQRDVGQVFLQSISINLDFTVALSWLIGSGIPRKHADRVRLEDAGPVVESLAY